MNIFHRIAECSAIFSFVFANLNEKAAHVTLSGICREIRTKFQQEIIRKNAKFVQENEKNREFIFHSRKNVDDFWVKFWDWRTVQRSALCRSRRELSNEHLLDEIGVDTAENEPVEVWGKNSIHYSFAFQKMIFEKLEKKLEKIGKKLEVRKNPF